MNSGTKLVLTISGVLLVVALALIYSTRSHRHTEKEDGHDGR